MQNNICLSGVKLNAQKLFHTNSRAEIFATVINCVIDDALLKNNDARHRSSAASVHRRHEPARPAAAFYSTFLLPTGFRPVLLGDKRSGVMNAGVSFQKVDCLTGSLNRNIALLEAKELATDLTQDRQ